MNVTRYKCSVLVIDDDAGVLAVLAEQLSADFEVLATSAAAAAREILSQRSVDVVLCDLRLPDGSGLDLLDWVRRTSPRTARVLLTGTGRMQDAVDAINHSQVHRIVLKPWRAEDFLQTLRTISRALLLERSHEQLLDDMRKMNEELERRVQLRTMELERANEQLKLKTTELERANEQLRQNKLDLERANEQLKKNQQELEKQQEELKKLATTDELTGIHNRREIEKVARAELERRNRAPSPLALILIDADHFGQVNRDYSLTAGDQVLKWLTGVLGDSIRATDALGRVGGEEFMIVAPNADADGAERLAERLRASVEADSLPYTDDEGHTHTLRLTISVGVAVADADTPTDFDRLRALAADAEKEAKGTGRNRVVLRVLAPSPVG